MSLLGKILNKQVQKVKKSFEETLPRIDANWPLNFALGRTVQIEETAFILTKEESFLNDETQPDYSVLGCGISKISKLIIYTFYLKQGDKIVVTMNEKEEILSTEFYILWERVLPQTSSEWDVWLNSTDGILGWKDFMIDEEEFQRTFPNSLYDRVEPMNYTEKYTEDPTGDDCCYINHDVAMYARPVGDTVGRVIIDNSNHGDDCISIYIGLEIPKEFIKVF
jgi:hypothetical protein